VSGDIFYQPVDRIKCVSRLVYVALLFILYEWSYVNKFSPAHPAAPYVLHDHNISFAEVITFVVRPPVAKAVRSVRRTVVGRSFHQNRMLFCTVPGNINGGKKPYAIPHRNRFLNFIVIVSEPGAVGVDFLCRAPKKDTEEED